MQKSKLAVASAVLLSAMAPAAFAAGEVASGIAAVQTEVTTYIGLGITAAFVLLGLSLAPDIGLGLVKKWVRKGAK